MSDTVETGGTECSDEEAQAALSIMFASHVGDAIRALRTYGDKRVAEALAATVPSWGGEPAESDS